MVSFLVVVGIPVLVILWAIGIYNRLIKAKNLVDEGWSNIDVQLKQRTNLIPNLVNTVKGYVKHERELLTNITQLRNQSLSASTVAQQGNVENTLSQSLGRLFAVAEAYPDLKANQQFLDVQQQLSQLEDNIQMARRYYNGTVRNLNTMIESFPNNLLAGTFHFSKREYFELDDPGERAVPKVEF
ncbi:LemA family protein [candidate division KSB1 bacterium]|nr:LemA family protein [candidate division KSB1 bacterium]